MFAGVDPLVVMLNEVLALPFRGTPTGLVVNEGVAPAGGVTSRVTLQIDAFPCAGAETVTVKTAVPP